MKKIRILIVLLLVLAMLCACGQQTKPAAPVDGNISYIPDGLSPKEPDGTDIGVGETSPETSGAADISATGDGTMGNVANQQFSNDAGTSIDVLREEIGQTTAIFGMAYIGYFDDASGIEFDQWLEHTANKLIYYYPFISEIDQQHTVGTKGHLYCVIAKNDSASIAVDSVDGEGLYRSQNGDPILLFCHENGDTQTADTVVTVTDGTAYRWEPKLDELGFPSLLIGAERELFSYDFTPVGDTGIELEEWLSRGWLGPMAAGLAGGTQEGMSWWISTWDDSQHFCMTFYPNGSHSYDGEAVLECFYSGDTEVQAQWQGWWRLETQLDEPSRLELDLMLMDGGDQSAFENASVVSEAYQVLIHPSGETVLLVADGAALLPVFPEGVQAIEMTLGVG